MTKGKLGSGGVALFTLCAVIGLDTLTAVASIGVCAVGWLLLTLVLFVIPYGKITSELSTTYPGQGGIYEWVHRAFGPRWAARTSWLYWINVGLWMPAVYILFAGILTELFAPELSLHWQVAICIVLTWLTVWICNLSVNIGLWVTKVCASLKMMVIFTLGIGGFCYAYHNGMANELSLNTILPSASNVSAFLPTLVFNVLGFELVATLSNEMKDVRELPRAVFLAIGITVALYLFSTLGILMALPEGDVGLLSGVIDTLRVLFGDLPSGTVIVKIVGGLTLLTLVGNMVAWTMGSSRAAAEASSEGELPKLLGRMSKRYNTPIGANTLTGMVSTVVIITYAVFADSADDLFWSVFAFSSCIALLPYLMMLPAHVRLRQDDPDRERPYRVAGGLWVQKAMVAQCLLVILLAIVLFIFPELSQFSVDWRYSAPVMVGVIATLVIGEMLVKRPLSQATGYTEAQSPLGQGGNAI
ncbi:APC family permease [Ferrimonas futtsuensis]|uniref:APC family permease n=1 Tax=Ferrimonas futtsuensis TaxID=364764 RepID=UPI0003F53A40|nr:APC family permease [Ferrimonas futtsuensis]